MQDLQLENRFDYYFASHLIGLAKPNPLGFLHVADEIGLPPENILFIDDNLTNIESAEKLGFVARQAQGFEQVKQRLAEFDFQL